MVELSVYRGLDCIGYIRETEGRCDAVAIASGQSVQLGRFANRDDARVAIREATCSPRQPIVEAAPKKATRCRKQHLCNETHASHSADCARTH